MSGKVLRKLPDNESCHCEESRVPPGTAPPGAGVSGTERSGVESKVEDPAFPSGERDDEAIPNFVYWGWLRPQPRTVRGAGNRGLA